MQSSSRARRGIRHVPADLLGGVLHVRAIERQVVDARGDAPISSGLLGTQRDVAFSIFFLAVKEWAAYLLLILLGIDLIVRGATGLSVQKPSGQ